MERSIEFVPLLKLTQEYISSNYSAALLESNSDVKKNELCSYIKYFLQNNGYEISSLTTDQLVEKLYCELAEYSVLTKYLNADDVEEINVNAWNDVAITYCSGEKIKLKNPFFSPGHAEDIIKRLLRHSGIIIDNANPRAQGHLNGNVRVTALKNPLVDDDVGITASIRILHHSNIDKSKLVTGGNATNKMVDFLCMCLRYGISTLIAGATSSGKTTLLNALLETIPDNLRIFTIETGSRELSLIRHDDNGNVINNVVHTLSRHSDNELYNVSQEMLVMDSLRYDPDIVVVGEMRDSEAAEAVEASQTGHTVVTTVHAYGGEQTHVRVAMLMLKKFNIDFNIAMMQVAQAFPLLVYSHKLENNERKIMEITECEVLPNGERIYHTLFRYHITRNDIVDGKCVVEGHFEQVEIMSQSLQKRLLQFGVPYREMEKFLERGAEYIDI